MKILVIDSCIRANSKTRMVLNAFLDTIDKNNNTIEKIVLNNNSKLVSLNDTLLEKRNNDCLNKTFNDSYYDFAKSVKNCDCIIVAAPFYDLTFPSVMKIFIEQTLISNLTFVDTPQGVKGIVNCKKMIYIAVRGMECNDTNNIDIGSQYLRGYCNMLGIPELEKISYSGITFSELEQKIKDNQNKYKEIFTGYSAR